jgi:hypothetical protein
MATTADKIEMYRERAKDKSLPQEVRNQYLDKATELEYKAYEETKAGKTTSNTAEKKMAKGGAVVAKAPSAKAPMKAPMAKMPMKMPAVKPMMNKGGAVKPKAMAKGGSVKKGKC